MLSSLRKFSHNEVAQKRMEILSFYDEFGEKATKQAFGADRRVISRWKKRFKESGGKLASLFPVSTKPHHVRRSVVHTKIVEFIKSQRQDHPRIGKEKLKPDLDEECQRLGIETVSTSTIGNIIKRHKFFYQKQGKAYHNPNSKWAQNKTRRKKRLRIRHSPKPKDYGHILSDTVERITDGVKDYFMSAIDAKMKFALTLNYKRITSKNMKDFYERFQYILEQSGFGNQITDQKTLVSLISNEKKIRFHIYLSIPDVQRLILLLNGTTEPFKKSLLTIMKTLFMTKSSLTKNSLTGIFTTTRKGDITHLGLKALYSI